MDIQQISSRTYLFGFPLSDEGVDCTYIIVIRGDAQWYVIDTALGPDTITEIRDYLGDDFRKANPIVINTHAHFDHIWGNCAFPESMIVGHRLCKQDMEREQQLTILEKQRALQRGMVRLVAPNITIESRLTFERDGIELYHTPGHTRGAISIIDHVDRVLYLGDNVGLPIPSIYPGVTVDAFIHTMETYLTLDVQTIVSSHYGVIPPAMIEDNLYYLRKLAAGDTEAYDQGEVKFFNDWNKKMLA